MNNTRRWTKEEVDYLQERWGGVSIKYIATHLNRTVSSIKNKAYKIGLRRHIHSGEYVTLHQLLVGIGQEKNYSYLNYKLQKYGLPVKYKKSIDKKYKVVYIDDFWKWTEKNQNLIDFSDFKENMLGPEPKWVNIKRKNDIDKHKKIKTSPWTEHEDKRLEELLNKYKYSYKELSKMLNRSEGAIQRRVCDLNLKARPIKADNHIKWTKEEYSRLVEMIKERYTYEMMSDVLGKSSKAIRGTVYRMYKTERLDRVVEIINNI